MNEALIWLSGFIIGLSVARPLAYRLGVWVARRRERIDRAITTALASGPMMGLDIVKASGGVVSRGTVYINLMRLEEDGVVTSEPVGDGRRRYRLWFTPRPVNESGVVVCARCGKVPRFDYYGLCQDCHTA